MEKEDFPLSKIFLSSLVLLFANASFTLSLKIEKILIFYPYDAIMYSVQKIITSTICPRSNDPFYIVTY